MNFFNIFVVLLVEERPDCGWSSSDKSPRLNRENHSQTLAWLNASSLKASQSIVTVSAAVFPKRKLNSVQTCCSYKSAIEKSTKTMTEAQEKNHTDHIDLSSRTPHGQLMQRAVMYMHQARAGETNAPLPSKKKFSLFLGPPIYVLTICVLHDDDLYITLALVICHNSMCLHDDLYTPFVSAICLDHVSP